ncbi:MAG TPA: STAS/SEC14 domain-containing protein, partial [Cyclobacteriaceae bacterium]|nr:STAS/SEC14 domain-containing protein [Cyclobacteriaceae bacterium]
ISGKITKEEFDKIVLPPVAELIQRTDNLNYLLVLDTPLRNFTVDAWMKDALLTLHNLNKWNRVALVSDSENLRLVSHLFNSIPRGECKGFTPDQTDAAIAWVGGVEKQVFQPEDDLRE